MGDNVEHRLGHRCCSTLVRVRARLLSAWRRVLGAGDVRLQNAPRRGFRRLVFRACCVVVLAAIIGVVAAASSGHHAVDAADAKSVRSAQGAASAQGTRHWVTIAALSDKSRSDSVITCSPAFALGSAQTRLTYSVKGDVSAFEVSVPSAGTIPLTARRTVTRAAAGKGTIPVHMTAGSYFLWVTSADCSWTVSIQQLR